MAKKYTRSDMRRILRQDIGTSALTEQKIQEAYAFIRRDAAVRSSEGALGKVVYYPQDGQQEYQEEYNGTKIKQERVRKGNNGRKQSRKNRRALHLRPRRWLVLAAAVGVLAVSSLTALALNGFFAKTVTQEEGAVDYKFDVNFDLTMEEVDVQPGYLPEGYQQMQSNSFKFHKGEDTTGGITITMVDAAYLAQEESGGLNIEKVKQLEETTINGKEAHLITIDVDTERHTQYFDKRIYLFTPEDGYVCVLYGFNDLPMEELVKVAENLQFTKTGETVKIEKESLLEKGNGVLEAIGDRIQKKEEKISWDYGVPAEELIAVGEPFTARGSRWEPGAEDITLTLTVTDVEICDSISGFPQENFEDYERLQKGLNEDGTLKPYKRFVGEIQEDFSVEEVAREEAMQKFVKVSIHAENPTDEAGELWVAEAQLKYLKQKENGDYAYSTTYTEPLNVDERLMSDLGWPIYFDRTHGSNEYGKGFYRYEMQPKETLDYTLIYLVDEDRLDEVIIDAGGSYTTGFGTGYDPQTKEFVRNYIDLGL